MLVSWTFQEDVHYIEKGELRLELPLLRMWSTSYSGKYGAWNLPLSSSAFCSHFKNWMSCVVLKWEGGSCCVPTVSAADRNQEGPAALPLSWLFSESVQVLSRSRGLSEPRELDRIEELKAARPGGKVGSWSGPLCFLGGPVSFSQPILMEMVTPGSLLGDPFAMVLPILTLASQSLRLHKNSFLGSTPRDCDLGGQVGAVNLHFWPAHRCCSSAVVGSTHWEAALGDQGQATGVVERVHDPAEHRRVLRTLGVQQKMVGKGVKWPS